MLKLEIRVTELSISSSCQLPSLLYIAIICFGGNFLQFEDKKKLGLIYFFSSIVQIEKKLQNFWKNSQNFWNQKMKIKIKIKLASSWAENRHQSTKSKNVDPNNQQLKSKIWYELAFWGLATSVGWLLLLKKNCWVG